MRVALIHVANYDWASINPTIFGALFQLIKTKDERRELGEHYTSEENINKIVYPLFLDELQERLASAWDNKKALKDLRKDLGMIKILDPACGCGNFLVVSYRHLRQLELELTVRLQQLEGKESDLGLDGTLGLVVGLHQFYGIEIEEWPAQVARMALFLTDHQENLKLEQITGTAPNRFPLTESAIIVNTNALRTDWKTVCPMSESTFILGNPPFYGARFQLPSQKEDTREVWGDTKSAGELDYVANWYLLAARQIAAHGGHAAFVATNSIVQGEQPAIIWSLMKPLGMSIDFAHQTFRWSNDAAGQAAVHVVIIGFSKKEIVGPCKLWRYANIDGSPELHEVNNINAYLADGRDITITPRRTPLSTKTPKMDFGSMPNDGGFLSDLSDEDAERIVETDEVASKFLRKLIGGQELVHSKSRFCLWLVEATPTEVKRSPILNARVSQVRTLRGKSKRPATKKLASTPTLFGEIRQPSTPYLAVPLITSENRNYLTVALMPSDVIANNKIGIIADGSLTYFAILSSQVFTVWNKTVSGRLKSDLNVSITITYNNFPFPDLEEATKLKLEILANDVLDARERFKPSSLAELYDPTSMPPALAKAHEKLDEQVLAIFQLPKSATDSQILEALFKMYEQLSKVKI
jgi:hypothetical protein